RFCPPLQFGQPSSTWKEWLSSSVRSGIMRSPAPRSASCRSRSPGGPLRKVSTTQRQIRQKSPEAGGGWNRERRSGPPSPLDLLLAGRGEGQPEGSETVAQAQGEKVQIVLETASVAVAILQRPVSHAKVPLVLQRDREVMMQQEIHPNAQAWYPLPHCHVLPTLCGR